MLPRDPNLLSLQATQETNTIVPSRIVLSAILLLALPFEDESSISKRRRLKEVITGGEWEKEGEVLR